MNNEGFLDKEQIETLIAKKGISPFTRRLIVWILGTIAIFCIGAEVALAYLDKEGSDALMAIAAAAVGGISGMAQPAQTPGN